MNRPSVSKLLILFILAFASTVHAQPQIAEIKPILCAADGIADCAQADYSAPMAIDVNGDGTREYVYALTNGGDDLCHVRHACFTLVQRHGGTWRVLLRGMGGSIGTTGSRAYRDLVVIAANSADEHEHIRYRFRRGAYHRIRQRSCGLDDTHADCHPPDGEVALQ